MKTVTVEKLLDKYFEGETTLEEERWIAAQLTKPNVPAHLQPYKKLFAYYANERKVTSHHTPKLPRAKKIHFKWAYAVAASIVLGFFSYTFWIAKASEPEKYSDQEKIVIAQLVLKQIELQMREGQFMAQKGVRKYKITNEKFINY